MPSARGLALLGPGLDGQLAIELIRRQGSEVVAATFATPFTAYYEQVQAAAARRDVPLITLQSDADYLQRVAHPRFGYTREMAPCLDCKVAMLVAAREQMSTVGASFLITGDVVGQRLPGQSKRDFALVDFHAGVEDLVVRPLSALLLEPTAAERAGEVRRENLLSINGRSRQEQLALAKSWQWSEIPSVTSGCLLADAAYARKFRDTLEHDAEWQEHVPFLAVGRQFRVGPGNRVILGRNAAENQQLAEWHAAHASDTFLLHPGNFVGPTALVVGNTWTDEGLATATQLVLHYARKSDTAIVHEIVFTQAGNSSTIAVRRDESITLPAAI